MKASEVGMSLFELLHKLMVENESQKGSIRTLKESLSNALKTNTDLTNSHNIISEELKKAATALAEYQKKDKTYAEIFRENES